MLSIPRIIQTTVQEAAVIRLTIPRSEMMTLFGPAVGELMGALAAQGVEPVDAVFAHHLKMSPDIFDFELGVKVSAPIKATGRVKPGQLPAAKVARALNLWELYSVGPQSTPDPANWRTELNRPLTN